MQVVYIAGPFRAKNSWDMEQHIRRAEELALQVWRLGCCAVICPHTNTRFFQGAADDAIWLEGDLELLRRSDVVLMVRNWQRSVGASKEYELAKQLGRPVFTRFSDLEKHLFKKT